MWPTRCVPRASGSGTPPGGTTTTTTASPTSPKQPRPKAIIFDLLTALLDSWTAWDFALAAALRQEPSPTNTALARTWRHAYLALTYTTGRYVPYATLVRTAARQTPGVPPAAADMLLDDYARLLVPWPEAMGVLTRLKDAGYALAVATNCSKELGRDAIAGFDLPLTSDPALTGGGKSVFDVVVTAEESGWYKPAREAYAAVLERLGLGPNEVLFVAGSAADVPGARGAGIERVVWHNRVGMEAKPGAEGLAEKEGRTLVEVLEGVLL